MDTAQQIPQIPSEIKIPGFISSMKYIKEAGFWGKTVFILVSLVLLIFVYQWASSPMIVTVTGAGEVFAPAESATLTFTLSSSGDNPQTAVNTVKSISSKIKESLKPRGIPESDIYESQVAVYPASVVIPGASDFRATVNMGVKTTHINNLDELTLSLYAQGATLVTQSVLAAGNTQNLEKEASAKAIVDAKKQAANIALGNWKLIRKIVAIQQTTSPRTSTITSKADTATQIEQNYSPETGVIKISKVVSVSYKMW